MNTLMKLHQKLMNESKNDMFGTHKLPIEAQHDDTGPVIPVERWVDIGGCLKKTYRFRTLDMRNRFVRFLLTHEEDVGHSAELTLTEECVCVKVKTKDIDQVTELDKEYARTCDLVYKDVCY